MVGLSMLRRFSLRIPTTAILSLSMRKVIYSITFAQHRVMLERSKLRLSITLSIWRLIIRRTITIGRSLSRPTMAIYTRYVTRNKGNELPGGNPRPYHLRISHRRPCMARATLSVVLVAGPGPFLDAYGAR